jgi:hypothetical protein
MFRQVAAARLSNEPTEQSISQGCSHTDSKGDSMLMTGEWEIMQVILCHQGVWQGWEKAPAEACDFAGHVCWLFNEPRAHQICSLYSTVKNAHYW